MFRKDSLNFRTCWSSIDLVESTFIIGPSSFYIYAYVFLTCIRSINVIYLCESRTKLTPIYRVPNKFRVCYICYICITSISISHLNTRRITILAYNCNKILSNFKYSIKKKRKKIDKEKRIKKSYEYNIFMNWIENLKIFCN